MKILHTSDWHLGHTLYHFDRTEEQSALLDQLVDLTNREKPDVFLVSGDLYHTSQPSAAVQKLFAQTMVRLHDAHPAMTLVVTAGNHDSGSRHEVFRLPWEALNVHAIGQLDKANLDRHLIEVPGKGFVVAVPYVHESFLPDGFFQQLLDRVAERNPQQLPVVLSAHLTVQGCDFTGHDRATEATVGGIDAWNVSQLGEGYDYLALGHIHRPQFVHTGRHNVRYSGTPMAVSFDENYPHTVSIVEIGQRGDTPQVREVEIHNPRPLVTLPAQGTATWEEAQQLLRQFPDDQPAYLRVKVVVEDFLPVEAPLKAAALCEGKEARFCLLQTVRSESEKAERESLSVETFQQVDPLDLVRRYAADIGSNFDSEMEALFREAVESLKQED
ncbi:nuclease SbcCD, D subunit [gut metagenome]|uniref:Nuclease SbcCD subunit D n=1 Tax=gut metagenome TaxID=749906 RepID=J9GNK9_9ZZZZ